MPDSAPHTVVVPVLVDERAKEDADAALKPAGLTSSQFLSLVLEGIAHDKDAIALVKWANSFGPPPTVPNAETVEAIEAARRGETKTFNTVEKLIADLNSDADD
jgi:DNA-damage-inducible protein J